jgi:23S rRNA (uridine2552-2'-O)-methyltransferase
MRLEEARKDLYRRLAKEQGYKSRAAFKLIEANEKYRFISEGDVVIDFGSAPGGWLQVSSELIGERGLVVGLDLAAMSFRESNIRTLRSDVYGQEVAGELMAITGRRADVILSDLSPTVSGVWELDHIRQVDLTFRVLDLSETLLRRGGNAFFKGFDGERSRELRDRFKASFSVARPYKPPASRNVSSELYYYCQGWQGWNRSENRVETA